MHFRFSILGIPVRLEPIFFLIPILALRSRDAASAAIWTVVVFLSVLVHELGHALAMRRFGFEPSITLHMMGGLTHYPPNARPTPRSDFFITLAGPAAGLALGGLTYGLLRSGLVTSDLGRRAIDDSLWVNVAWSFVNLLPILPWDGGLLLDAGLRWATGRPYARVSAGASILCGVAVLGIALRQQVVMLAYFGALGVYYGYVKWRGAADEPETAAESNPAPEPSLDELWNRLQKGDDLRGEITRLVETTSGERRHALLELLAWAQLFQRDADGAQRTIDRLAPVAPSRSLQARMAAARDDIEAVIGLLSPPGAALPQDLPLLVSALIARGRFDDVVALCETHPDVAGAASERLFHAGAYAQSLAICSALRARTSDALHAYNEACCLCRLGRPDEAVEALRTARTLGARNLDDVDTDEDLALIRDRPAVRELVEAARKAG